MSHTLINIVHILESLDSSQMPPVKRVLEGRQFLAVRFLGVGTIGVAHIIVCLCSQEYNMYSRTIRQQVDAPNPMGAQGQAVFCSWIYWGWALWAWLVLLL